MFDCTCFVSVSVLKSRMFSGYKVEIDEKAGV